MHTYRHTYMHTCIHIYVRSDQTRHSRKKCVTFSVSEHHGKWRDCYCLAAHNICSQISDNAKWISSIAIWRQREEGPSDSSKVRCARDCITCQKPRRNSGSMASTPSQRCDEVRGHPFFPPPAFLFEFSALATNGPSNLAARAKTASRRPSTPWHQ